MKRKLYLFFIGTVCMLANAQTVEVEYRHQVNLTGQSIDPIERQYVLQYSNGKSVQKNYLKGQLIEKVVDRNGNSVRFVKGKDTTYIYKDFTNGNLIAEGSIMSKTFAVLDKVDLFAWEIQADTTTILNHKCRKATTKFRGREYAAYFAEDIPIPDGPVKFNGLPGLILKLEILNSTGIYKIEAVGLKITDESTQINNPFEKEKLMPFAEFKKEYNRKYDEFAAFAKSDNPNMSVSIPKGGLEIIWDE